MPNSGLIQAVAIVCLGMIGVSGRAAVTVENQIRTSTQENGAITSRIFAVRALGGARRGRVPGPAVRGSGRPLFSAVGR